MFCRQERLDAAIGSTAYKGTPGKCCGVIHGQAFCCPGAGGEGAGGAKCYNCGETHRCYVGFPAANICGGGGGGAPVLHRSHRQRLPEGGGGSSESDGFRQMLLAGFLFLIFFLVCVRGNRQDTQPYPLNYGMAPRAVGCPMGCPAGCPVGVGAPISYGYSGYGAAGGAAAGFAGGVLVSEMMHASHHRHDYYSDRYDGPSYVDSRSTCGGDSCYDGGDSGFAADS